MKRKEKLEIERRIRRRRSDDKTTFSRGAQKVVGRETIAMKSHRRGLNRVARSLSIFPSSRRPDPTPDKTHRYNRERPVSDRGPPPVGSPPRNWRCVRMTESILSRCSRSRTIDPLSFTIPRMADCTRFTEASALSFLSSRNYFSGSKVVPVVSTARP